MSKHETYGTDGLARSDYHNVEIPRLSSLLSESINLTQKSTKKDENHNNNNAKHRLTLALALFAIGGLVFSGINFAGIARAQDDPAGTEAAMIETQQSSVQYLTGDLTNQGDLNFKIRWSPVTTLEPDTMTAMFADCNPNEFAVSSMEMFENQDIQTVQSFPVAVPDDLMSWITVAFNSGEEALQASTGVVCVGDDNEKDTDGVNLSPTTRLVIQNTVNRVIQEGGGDTIVNLRQITNVYQSIVQKAIQIINITGNNNTVTQIINQSASQIVEGDGLNVNQTIDQNAEQVINQNITAPTPVETPPVEEPVENTTATARIQEEQQTVTETPFAPPIDPETGGVDTPEAPVDPPVDQEEPNTNTQPEEEAPEEEPTETPSEEEPVEEETTGPVAGESNIEETTEETDGNDNTADGT